MKIKVKETGKIIEITYLGQNPSGEDFAEQISKNFLFPDTFAETENGELEMEKYYADYLQGYFEILSVNDKYEESMKAAADGEKIARYKKALEAAARDYEWYDYEVEREKLIDRVFREIEDKEE